LQGHDKAQSYTKLAASVRASGGKVVAELEELAASEHAAASHWGQYYRTITSAGDVRLKDVEGLFIRVGTVDPMNGLPLSNYPVGASYRCA
jgi:hypothetical protein